jgi:D-alanine-D-alanine ligase
MQQEKIKLALVYGGRSAEHEVSLRSARSIFEAMDRERYDVLPLLINAQGAWYKRPAQSMSFDPDPLLDEADRVVLSHDPGFGGLLLLNSETRAERIEIDVVFPVLHGTYGEDGTLQGLLELADVPYVGCGVLASAVGMDKVLMKAAFKDADLLVGPFSWFLRSEWREDSQEILRQLGDRPFPLFVKPANLGSSVGITRAHNLSELEAAIEHAASFDRKILVEDEIQGRELEVSVLGNDASMASVPGEIISHSEFYDYEEKYLKDSAELRIPAELSPETIERAQSVALASFKAVDGSGLGRIDMFLTPDERLVVNEINTLPGFTSISMYPKLWGETGISYAELIDRLVDLALQRYEDKKSTRTDR